MRQELTSYKLLSDGRPQIVFGNKKRFRLTETLEVQRLGTIYSVPKGFETDLASIPNVVFWWQWGWWNVAAILHDYLYQHGYLFRESLYEETGSCEGSIFKRSRLQADCFFYAICRDLGVDPITAGLMFLAVRLFGGRSYVGNS